MNKLKDVPYYIDDNFVPLEIQDKLEKDLIGQEHDFPWYYLASTVSKNYDSYNKENHKITEKEHFYHAFVNDGEYNSDFKNVVKDLVSLLPSQDRLYRVKANLMLQDKGGNPDLYNTPHYDFEWEKDGAKYQKDFYVGLYYVIDSDGDTFLFDKNDKIMERIPPKKGRMLFMRGDVLHASRHPINFDRRLVINMDIFT
jgi:hypothetical protein